MAKKQGQTLYIVRGEGGEKAVCTLRQARFESLRVERGQILRIHLRSDLSNSQLRCALFNRSDYAAEIWLVAEIEKGIARKVEPCRVFPSS